MTLAKPDYDVLNVLALKKMAGPPAIAAVVELSPEDVAGRLETLSGSGLVVVAGGAALPTDDAEPALAATATAIYAVVRADEDLLALVEKFESTNAQLLSTMSSWQQLDVGGRKVANDHTDAEYDEKVITRLERLVGRLDALIDALAAHDARFATYATRFGAALEGIDSGDHDLVSSPTRDSIHTVWFEFHEDLLRTLGRERAEWARPGWTRAFTDDGPADAGVLGGKGAGLVRMTRDGLRVPPGCVITTEACHVYLEQHALPDGLLAELRDRLTAIETATGKTFGSGPEPLLLSVRSGAPVSMPGMMDTVLNLGLSREAAVALAARSGDTRFVADLVARFHAMYSEIVLGALDDRDPVDALVSAADPADDAGAVYDRVWAAAEAALADELGESVPATPDDQLRHAVEAVFRSWNTRRARTYREHHGIPHDMGTAVVVQSMVFGNLDDASGSGVVFTRNPVTGEPGLYGEYLAHSQGEDVVAGTRTPDPVARALPSPLLDELTRSCAGLEARHGDVLDVEFTVEHGVLYFLQVRSAKRTPEAAVRIAADLLRDGTASPARALSLVTGDQLRAAQRPGFDEDALAAARDAGRVLVTGIGACPGQVCGELVLDPDRAKERAEAGAAVILARSVTSPADLHGMIAARGIVTSTGGSTSHAAVVARALGTACVVGAAALEIDAAARTLRAGERTLTEGDPVSLDGASGELVTGTLPTTTPAAANEAMDALLAAAADAAGCEVLARVTVPADVVAARAAGATGVVTAVDDVLAASGDLNHLVETLLEKGWDGVGSGTALDEVRQAIARQVSGLLAAAGDHDVDVRAIDLLADEARELLQQTAVTTRHPELALPLGVPALLAAQRAGLALAAGEAGYGGRMRLAVRHVSDPAEVRALRDIDGPTDAAAPGMGVYLTSPRAVLGADALAEHSDVVWLEVRALQAAMFGIPARQFLTAAPLDDYVARGLLSIDPRHAIDPTVEPLLAGLAEVARAHPELPVGVRLTGAVADAVAARLYALGFRRFAVDLPEVRPLVLGLGRAALAGPSPTTNA